MAGIGKEIQFLVWILKLKSLVPEHSNHRENLLIKGAFLQYFLLCFKKSNADICHWNIIRL